MALAQQWNSLSWQALTHATDALQLEQTVSTHIEV